MIDGAVALIVVRPFPFAGPASVKVVCASDAVVDDLATDVVNDFIAREAVAGDNLGAIATPDVFRQCRVVVLPLGRVVAPVRRAKAGCPIVVSG